MKTRSETVRILVVNFGTTESPWNLFCGIDENRVIFFKYLEMCSLPAHGPIDTEMSFFRDNKIINSISPYVSGGHGASFGIRMGKHKVHTKFDIHQFSKFFSASFNEGDIIEIEKTDWDAEDNPLSLVSTHRSVGNNFHLVFHRDDIAKKIVEFSGMTYEELSEKSAIFENKPGESGRYISHY